MFKNVKKGDTVWCTYGKPGERQHRAGPRKVRSIGAKWLTLEDGEKFSATTGYGEYGWRVWPSRQAFETWADDEAAWRAFTHAFVSTLPQGRLPSAAQTEFATKILRGEVDVRNLVEITPEDAALLGGVTMREGTDAADAAGRRVDAVLTAQAAKTSRTPW